MSLNSWQSRLEEHFERLKKDRFSTAEGSPVFGLEHGLDPSEREELEKEILAHISVTGPCDRHWLAWVVYASELGYQYSGDEYWRTFEERTPGWKEHGDRYWVRDSFRTFHKRFGGAKPSGVWADQFSIICWPIMHAILAQDLQQQLARVLYELRFSLTPGLLQEPARLGERIQAASLGARSRFRNLAQQTLFLGQISAALLLRDEDYSRNLILPDALRRIVEDLNREQSARMWLRGAQNHANKQFRILGTVKSQSGERKNSVDSAEETPGLGFEPRLILRPTALAAWEVRLEIPDLSALLTRLPCLADTLSNSRCFIAAAKGRPFPRGGVLHGSQQATLRTWPDVAQHLLQFERSTPELDHILKAETRLTPGPRWLFRIAANGLAYEIKSQIVRPGQRYILLHQPELVPAELHAQAAQIDCLGIEGVCFEVPGDVSLAHRRAIEFLGLHLLRTVRVWPAGLPPARWDGEGRAEWLNIDRPCIALRSDYPFKSVRLALDDGTYDLGIEPLEPGVTVFVDLPVLSVGTHKLRIATSDGECLSDTEVQLRIREPRSWTPGAAQATAFRVFVEPRTPSFEQFWEGDASLTMQGPATSPVACRISLFGRLNNQRIYSEHLPALRLPVDADCFRHYFAKHLRNVTAVQELYDSSWKCRLECDAGKLGTFTLECERAFTAVRWVVQCERAEYHVRLVDDRGIKESATVYRYEFATPDHQNEVPFDPDVSYLVPKAGGLYLVCAGNERNGLILPPQVHTLEDLRIDPAAARSARSTEEVLRLLVAYENWAGARLAGNVFSWTMQRCVLKSLLVSILGTICGEEWERLERVLQDRDGNTALRNLNRAIADDEHGSGGANMLLAWYPELACKPTWERRLWFWRLGRKLFDPSVPDEVSGGVCEFALRLASCPQRLRDWGQDLSIGIEWLMNLPVLARAARFLVLSTEQEQTSLLYEAGKLYANWEWE